MASWLSHTWWVGRSVPGSVPRSSFGARSRIAFRMGVRPMVVGMTIVAFGTSAPEAVASLTAARMGSGGLALGNVLGSNIANIGLILGILGLLRPIHVPWARVSAEVKILVAMTLLGIALALFPRGLFRLRRDHPPPGPRSLHLVLRQKRTCHQGDTVGGSNRSWRGRYAASFAHGRVGSGLLGGRCDSARDGRQGHRLAIGNRRECDRRHHGCRRAPPFPSLRLRWWRY